MAIRNEALIIIPTYNEIDNLELLITDILALNGGFDILVVDDNSPDGTGQLADELAERLIEVNVMHRAGKLGLGTAYIAGFKWAVAQGYDYVFEMDCDFSHHPRYLPNFLEHIPAADLVIGSRYVAGGGTRNWGWLRKFISSGGNTFARVMLRLKTKDCTGGYRCYRREMLQRVPWDQMNLKGYAFQVGSVYHVEKLAGRVVEFPIIFEDRRVGKSKMSWRIVVEAFRYVVITALLGQKKIVGVTVLLAEEKFPQRH
ncbi:MAG: Undecaprenyl-phosphate mannosyltransferase [Anaerolineae bacterium]|nr:Undecaprenyl-phosphate mannosyltransferase [Anaerolineae bacterium]